MVLQAAPALAFVLVATLSQTWRLGVALMDAAPQLQRRQERALAAQLEAVYDEWDNAADESALQRGARSARAVEGYFGPAPRALRRAQSVAPRTEATALLDGGKQRLLRKKWQLTEGVAKPEASQAG